VECDREGEMQAMDGECVHTFSHLSKNTLNDRTP
jgi:hypothetical protein